MWTLLRTRSQNSQRKTKKVDKVDSASVNLPAAGYAWGPDEGKSLSLGGGEG